jgi:hypothetical protein
MLPKCLTQPLSRYLFLEYNHEHLSQCFSIIRSITFDVGQLCSIDAKFQSNAEPLASDFKETAIYGS